MMASFSRTAALVALLAASACHSTDGFFVPSRNGAAISQSARPLIHIPFSNKSTCSGTSSAAASRKKKNHDMSMLALPALPAAVTTATAAVKSAMLTGSHVLPIAGLTAVSSLAVVPLTIFRQAYSFSVGYGGAVAAMCASLIGIFGLANPFTKSAWTGLTTGAVAPPTLLAYAGLFYGMRLSLFLLLREIFVPSKSEQIKKLDKTSKPARIPFAAAVGMFYAFMVSPVLYALRGSGSALTCPLGICQHSILAKVQWVGVALAYLGLTTEAIADQHKFFVKWNYGYASSFVGPTGGLYSICRHPNYLGEILFWTGIYFGGLPSFGKNIVAWVAGTLGLWGIVSIMTGATKRLDEKQADRYEGQLSYKSWRDSVKAPLFPFVK